MSEPTVLVTRGVDLEAARAVLAAPAPIRWLTDERKAELFQQLKYYPHGQRPSDVGYRVADMLDIAVGGLHHIDQRAAKAANWSDTLFVSMDWRYPNLGTFDGDVLTRLVFLAHDLCIRIEIDARKAGVPTLMFHPRRCREGGFSARHPHLADAVRVWRESHPAEGLLA